MDSRSSTPRLSSKATSSSSSLKSALRRSKRSSGHAKDEESNKELLNQCFVFTLVCPYLFARDLLAVSLVSNAIGHRLRSSGVKSLRVRLNGLGDASKCEHLCALLYKNFSRVGDVGLLHATRHEISCALSALTELKLKRLSITLSDVEDETIEPYLDGRSLARAVIAFPQLERLEVRNVGPMAPICFYKMTSSSPHLKMIRLTKCGTLTDPCLSMITLHAASLQELTLEECPALVVPIVSSSSLVRLKLSRCVSLMSVIAQCPHLMILDVMWTSALTEPPSLTHLPLLHRLSLAGAVGLESLVLTNLPQYLVDVDLGSCTNLKEVICGPAPQLVTINFRFCFHLTSITLLEVSRMEEIDLSLLPNLRRFKATHDFQLKRVVAFGCESLQEDEIHVNSTCRLLLSSAT